MDQLWAELMVIYNSGDWSLKLSEEIEHQLDIRRLEFMAEDTLTGVIQSWLDDYSGDYVCTKMIYEKAMRQYGEPDRKAIGEINDIMNNTVDGWLPGPSSHRFGREYGTQRAWHRKGVNEPLPDADGFVELMGTAEQLELPEEWLK